MQSSSFQQNESRFILHLRNDDAKEKSYQMNMKISYPLPRDTFCRWLRFTCIYLCTNNDDHNPTIWTMHSIWRPIWMFERFGYLFKLYLNHLGGLRSDANCFRCSHSCFRWIFRSLLFSVYIWKRCDVIEHWSIAYRRHNISSVERFSTVSFGWWFSFV